MEITSRAQRAWISLQPTITFSPEDSGRRIVIGWFQIQAKNTGLTPAVNVVFESGKQRKRPIRGLELFDLSEEDRRSEFVDIPPDYDFEGEASPLMTLFPTVEQTVKVPLAVHEFDGIREGVDSFYVYVRVSYNDVFSEDLRITNMCFRAVWTGRIINGSPAYEFNYKIMPKFNSAS